MMKNGFYLRNAILSGLSWGTALYLLIFTAGNYFWILGLMIFMGLFVGTVIHSGFINFTGYTSMRSGGGLVVYYILMSVFSLVITPFFFLSNLFTFINKVSDPNY